MASARVAILSIPLSLSPAPPRCCSRSGCWIQRRCNLDGGKSAAAVRPGMIAAGMHAAGYRTLSLDGGWWGGGKSGKVRRNSSGFLTVNDTKFPVSGKGGNGGLLRLSNYVTARGFLFGVYTSANVKMCSQDVGGSAGYEQKDATLFASWNISLMKLDDCGSSIANASRVMAKWTALYQQLMPDRTVALFNSQVGCCAGSSGACSSAFTRHMPQWCYDTSTTMYQPADGNDEWDIIIQRHHSVAGRGFLARPGSWLDPGYLTLDVGDNYYNGTNLPMKLDQNIAVFSLWVIVSAPLVASFSFSGRVCPAGSFGGASYGERCITSRPVPQAILDIVTNRAAIEINQQFDTGAHWHAGDLVWTRPNSLQLWAKPLPNGGFGAVLFRNHCSSCRDPAIPLNVSFALSDLPRFGRAGQLSCAAGGCTLLEVWSNDSRVVRDPSENMTFTLRRRQALLVRIETG
jgi:hypothetical protein